MAAVRRSKADSSLSVSSIVEEGEGEGEEEKADEEERTRENPVGRLALV